MSDLKVRRVKFDLAGDDIPFNWHPQRPAFAMQCNVVSFFAPGFEKLIVQSTREALPLMRDPEMVDEATDYIKQEGQHTAAHLAHLRALIRRWPGLKHTMDEVVASYDRLLATKPLAWRLAYAAVVEATFTPYFRVFLDHDDKLFEPGDERISSLFIWHFVEEMEHRSSALRVYDAVHDSYPYRLKTIAGVVKHLNEMLKIVGDGFREHVPVGEGGEFADLVPAGVTLRSMAAVWRFNRTHAEYDTTYAEVPLREMIEMFVGLVRSQAPDHDPLYERLPDFAARWFRRYDEDPRAAARWYSVGVGEIAKRVPDGQGNAVDAASTA
ncbi:MULTISPECIES: metal-dependent hydrolase [Gordonia]|uniref:metal-dependent hydrolase n=1 Tax=Gordonia TaxID=2053 RepID=UPI0007EBA71D|nr:MULTISPECIES: metal-dependent hydrolase [Gordonia]MCM3896681.1 metal-dependent hydrolase [Gordonia sputi]OBA65598.1 metal-dependent hydrolase [Gordonia sp. 852002-10350_SCH5691597]